MLYNVTKSVPFRSRIGPRDSIACPDEFLVAARSRFHGLGLFWDMWLVIMLGVARVAMNADGVVADHGLDGMGQHKFALATPTVNGSANLLLPICSYDNFHIPTG